MYRYTTPTITCTFEGVDFNEVALIRIAISGKDKTIIKEVAEIEETTVPVRLTQEETANLGSSDGVVAIQARIKYTDGTVQATNIVQTELSNVLDKVVI